MTCENFQFLFDNNAVWCSSGIFSESTQSACEAPPQERTDLFRKKMEVLGSRDLFPIVSHAQSLGYDVPLFVDLTCGSPDQQLSMQQIFLSCWIFHRLDLCALMCSNYIYTYIARVWQLYIYIY